MKQSSLHDSHVKKLEKAKAKSLTIFEILSMKWAGRSDGRKGLLREDEGGNWKSSKLREEVDSYEEFCATLYGHLKVEEEEQFKKLNTLMDGVTPRCKTLSEAKNRLKAALEEKVSLTERKVGEEDLTEAQVMARRGRERDRWLQPLYADVEKERSRLNQTTEEIAGILSQLKESFDSTRKIADRLLRHSQRRVDVYWRAAMRQNENLPAEQEIIFHNLSEEEYRNHFEALVRRAEMLSKEVALTV